MIEQDFARIASALERIANHLEGSTNNRPVIAAPVDIDPGIFASIKLAPVEAAVISAPAPTRGRPRKVSPVDAPTPEPVVEESLSDEPAPTLDTLRARLRALSSKGQKHRELAIDLLGVFSVARITDLPEAAYGAFSARLAFLEDSQ